MPAYDPVAQLAIADAASRKAAASTARFSPIPILTSSKTASLDCWGIAHRHTHVVLSAQRTSTCQITTIDKAIVHPATALPLRPLTEATNKTREPAVVIRLNVGISLTHS